MPNGEPPEKPGDETFKETTIEISKGDTISIATSDGTVLETVTADKDAKGVVFSSDALVQNETYTLFINGEAAATAKLLERILRNFKSLSAKMCVDAPPYKYTLLQPRTYSTQNARTPQNQ